MSKKFRRGAIGALMDEYERAAADIPALVARLTGAEFERIRDSLTQDNDCRSIQTVVSHVVRSGYGYADYIRNACGMASGHPVIELLSQSEFPRLLEQMLAYTVETLDGRWEYTDEQVQSIQIRARWGPTYDMEQLLEHAILHVLRHRRQIEKLLEQ